MKAWWKKYGVIVHALLLATWLALWLTMDMPLHTEDRNFKLFLYWGQFILFGSYFIQKLIIIYQRFFRHRFKNAVVKTD